MRLVSPASALHAGRALPAAGTPAIPACARGAGGGESVQGRGSRITESSQSLAALRPAGRHPVQGEPPARPWRPTPP